MARIVHIALKVDDLEKTTAFYEKVFGFQPVETSKVRDHTSRHLSDGTIDLALIKYDSEESAESLASGTGPCIHHFAIEVENFDQAVAEINKLAAKLSAIQESYPSNSARRAAQSPKSFPKRDTRNPIKNSNELPDQSSLGR